MRPGVAFTFTSLLQLMNVEVRLNLKGDVFQEIWQECFFLSQFCYSKSML